MKSHEHIMHTGYEWKIDRTDQSGVFTIYTNLKLNPLGKDFDKHGVAALIEHCRGFLDISPISFTQIRLVEEGS
jgi:hypothetical protein